MVEGPALDVDIRRLLKHGHQPIGRVRHPRLCQTFVIQRQYEHFKDVPSGSELGKDVSRCARPFERVNGKAAIGLLKPLRPVDGVLNGVCRCRPATGEV